MKELKVLKPFPYAGKQRAKGDRITATNRHAGLLVALGKVKVIEPEAKRSDYMTRDMRPAERDAGREVPDLTTTQHETAQDNEGAGNAEDNEGTEQGEGTQSRRGRRGGNRRYARSDLAVES